MSDAKQKQFERFERHIRTSNTTHELRHWLAEIDEAGLTASTRSDLRKLASERAIALGEDWS
jgi:hypothetical protein